MATLITLLTDFGVADSYVGEVKGVLLSQVHGVALVDISHQVPPGDVRAGQYILSRTWHRFPQGAVHFAVIDPGVGTARRALAVQAAGHFFVAPDNGLLSFLRPMRTGWRFPFPLAPRPRSTHVTYSRRRQANWPSAPRSRTSGTPSPTQIG